MSAFTPGPWRIQEAPLQACIYADVNLPGGGNIICEAPRMEPSLAHWQDNAHLIVAAPKLYAALTAALTPMILAAEMFQAAGEPEKCATILKLERQCRKALIAADTKGAREAGR